MRPIQDISRLDSQWKRLVLFVAAFLACFAIVFISTIKFDQIYKSNSLSVSVVFWQAIILTFFSAMHIFYLIIVVKKNVLDELHYPKTFNFHGFIVLLLCFAYMFPLVWYLGYPRIDSDASQTIETLFAASVSKKYFSAEQISLGFFAIVYAVWLYHDFKKWRDTTAMSFPHVRRKTERWMYADGFALSIILGSIIGLPFLVNAEISGSASLFNWWCSNGNTTQDTNYYFFCNLLYPQYVSGNLGIFGAKDIFVFICVILIGSGDIHWHSHPVNEPYVGVYKAYLGSIDAGTLSLEPNCKDNPIDQLKQHLAAVVSSRDSEELRVLDYGCADGSRLQWFLRQFELSEFKLHVTALDRNSGWEASIIDIDNDPKWEFVAEPSKIAANTKYDVIHFSHFLYEKVSVTAAIHCLEEFADENSLIIVRGASSQSPFYISSLVHAKRLLGYNPHHHWIDIHLRRLVSEASLVLFPPELKKGPAELGKELPPVTADDWVKLRTFTVNQEIKINETNKRTLAELMGILFGESGRRNADRILTDMDVQGVKKLPNDDNLWVFKKKSVG